MSILPSNVDEESQAIPLFVVFPSHGEGVVTAIDKALPSVNDIIPHNPEARSNFQQSLEVMTRKFLASMTSKHLAKFKTKFGLPSHVKLIPTGEDKVNVHPPRYYALYASPFTIGYSFPLLPPVKGFCRHYSIFPS